MEYGVFQLALQGSQKPLGLSWDSGMEMCWVAKFWLLLCPLQSQKLSILHTEFTYMILKRSCGLKEKSGNGKLWIVWSLGSFLVLTFCKSVCSWIFSRRRGSVQGMWCVYCLCVLLCLKCMCPSWPQLDYKLCKSLVLGTIPHTAR